MTESPVAVATVTKSIVASGRFEEGPSATVLITFFKVANNPNTLQFNAPQQDGLGALPVSTWIKAYSWYYWNQDQRLIKWGTSSGDDSHTATVFQEGITLTSSPVASSTPSATPSLSKPQIPATTPPPSETENPASSPSASTSPTQQSSGASNGVVAGVAIGCLIGGALIAGLVLWFCWGKRRATKSREHEASKVAFTPQAKDISRKPVSLGSASLVNIPLAGNHPVPFEDRAPLPLEDKAITGEISKISNSIKNHVQSYYHSGRVSPGLIDFDDVQALGGNMPVAVGTLSTLLGNSATREIALRFCIAWVICSRMLASTESIASLLPTEVQIILKTQPASCAHSSSLARWRSSTAELLQPTYVRNPFTTFDSRNGSIQAAIKALDNILQPYADSRMDNEQRRRNLEEIIKRSAVFAFTLFSQPSTWDFDWKVEQGVRSGELCIFPALVQLTDESGETVRSPRSFSEAVVRRLDG